MDTNKNFEDKLRERLANEELPFDPSAWESFLASESDETTPKSVKNEAFRKKWILWFSLLIVVTATGIYTFSNDIEFSITSKQDSEVSTEKMMSSQLHTVRSETDNDAYDISQVNSSENDQEPTVNSSPSVAEKIDQRENQKTIQKISALSKNQVSENTSTFIANKKNQSDSKLVSVEKYMNESDNLDQTIKTNQSDQQFNSTLLHNEKTILSPDLSLTSDQAQQAKLPILQKEGQNQNLSNSKNIPENKSRNTIENANVVSVNKERAGIALTSIQQIMPSLETQNRLNEIDTKNLTIPFDYIKNEIYFGIGMSKSNTESSAEWQARIQDRRATPLNLLKIGYNRRIGLRWQIGLEVNLNSLTLADTQKPFADYHQTSTTFEYIEGLAQHTNTLYLEVPLYIRYNPLGKRYGLLAGIKGSYALEENSFRGAISTAGENTKIIELNESITLNEHLKNYDLGLFLGGTYRIWKGIELEVRYNIGLNDVSHDNFWGEQHDNTSGISSSLNYRWKF